MYICMYRQVGSRLDFVFVGDIVDIESDLKKSIGFSSQRHQHIQQQLRLSFIIMVLLLWKERDSQ